MARIKSFGLVFLLSSTEILLAGVGPGVLGFTFCSLKLTLGVDLKVDFRDEKVSSVLLRSAERRGMESTSRAALLLPNVGRRDRTFPTAGCRLDPRVSERVDLRWMLDFVELRNAGAPFLEAFLSDPVADRDDNGALVTGSSGSVNLRVFCFVPWSP